MLGVDIQKGAFLGYLHDHVRPHGTLAAWIPRVAADQSNTTVSARRHRLTRFQFTWVVCISCVLWLYPESFVSTPGRESSLNGGTIGCASPHSKRPLNWRMHLFPMGPDDVRTKYALLLVAQLVCHLEERCRRSAQAGEGLCSMGTPTEAFAAGASPPVRDPTCTVHCEATPRISTLYPHTMSARYNR